MVACREEHQRQIFTSEAQKADYKKIKKNLINDMDREKCPTVNSEPGKYQQTIAAVTSA